MHAVAPKWLRKKAADGDAATEIDDAVDDDDTDTEGPDDEPEVHGEHNVDVPR